VIRGTQGGVVLEEERGSHLLPKKIHKYSTRVFPSWLPQESEWSSLHLIDLLLSLVLLLLLLLLLVSLPEQDRNERKKEIGELVQFSIGSRVPSI